MKDQSQRKTEDTVQQVTDTEKNIIEITVTTGLTMTNQKAETHPQEASRGPDRDQPRIRIRRTSSHVTSLLETFQPFPGIRGHHPKSFLHALSISAPQMTRMCPPPRSQRRRAMEASLLLPEIPQNRTNTSPEDPGIMTTIRSPSL